MDNVIIAQEAVHSMRTRKGRKGWIAVKIDMEKAYDRLKWVFIKETCEDAKLPPKFIRLVMQCVSTPSMQVLWNGGLTEEFKPSRGIR